jgi:predicted dehydrogenase
MTSNKIRVGVIGVGQIGKRHLETYLGMPEVEVTAIAGRDPARTGQVARDYAIGSWTTDYRELLEREEIDAVSVCLHNNLHREVSVAALEAGKHVFCEKPMAGTYADALAMQTAAQRNGKLLSIQLSTLFSPETKAARAVIEQGWLGKPYYASAVSARRRGRPYVDGYGSPAFVQKSQAAGGALFDSGVYRMAQVLYLLDNPSPLRISGRTYQETGMDPQRAESSGYDVEEFAVSLAFLEGDITLNILSAWAAHTSRLGSSYVLGSQGGVNLDPFEVYRSLGDLDLDATADLKAFEFRLANVQGNGQAYDGPIPHWIAALRGEVPLLPTAELALNAMLISEGIYRSHRENREINVMEGNLLH